MLECASLFRFLQKFLNPNSRKKTDPGLELDALLEAIATRQGERDRALKIPGWALLLRSPFRSSEPASSWLGGLPYAPKDIVWPRHVNGAPLHFLAQIDLASLKPEQASRSHHSGLPTSGALLIFGCPTHACYVLNPEQIAQSSRIAPPEDLRSLQQQGFFSRDRTFGYWPVDPVAFIDTDRDWPERFPNISRQPTAWIFNWGIAADDAEMLIKSLRHALTRGEQFEKRIASLNASGKGPSTPREIEDLQRERALHTWMDQRLPGLLGELEAWHETTLRYPPTDPIDRVQLDRILTKRFALASEIDGYPPVKLTLLRGHPDGLWNCILRDHPDLREYGNSGDTPAVYRPFVDAMITCWRGHCLFGRPTPPGWGNRIWEIAPELTTGENEFEQRVEEPDLREHDCLINIKEDELIQTLSEHATDLSVWCPRDRMATGRFDQGQFLRHNS